MEIKRDSLQQYPSFQNFKISSLNTKHSTSAMPTLKFYSLRAMHDSANDLLRSPSLKRALSHHQQDQACVQKISESSLKMLDSCGRTKEIIFLVKNHIQELQSTFHRIILGEKASAENKFPAYILHRKDLKKQMLKRLKLLKMAQNMTMSNGYDDNLTAVGDVLGEVRETIFSLLELRMLLMCMPSPNPNPKSRKSMKCNGFISAKAKFMRVNSLSPWEKCDVHGLRQAIERLEAVESAVEDLEVELECIFKRLIRTRVLLLNILSS